MRHTSGYPSLTTHSIIPRLTTMQRILPIMLIPFNMELCVVDGELSIFDAVRVPSLISSYNPLLTQ